MIRDVPFYPENRHWCGPASLAGVMNHYDPESPGPDTIAEVTYSPSAGGTLMADLAWFAREHEFQVKVTPLNVVELRKYVDRGTPIIVFVSRSGWIKNYNHFMVVIGYTNEGMIVNSGLREEQYISVREFRSFWKRNGQYALLVTPRKPDNL